MKILIVPEDPTLDQYILKPIVERICVDHGLRARVDVLRDPHLSECDPKERFADPFIASRGWSALVGRGRKKAMRDLGAGWQGLLQVCPELRELHQQVGSWAAARTR